jgi:hypothetical protein
VSVLGKSGFVYDGVVIAAGVGTTWRFRLDRCRSRPGG